MNQQPFNPRLLLWVELVLLTPLWLSACTSTTPAGAPPAVASSSTGSPTKLPATIAPPGRTVAALATPAPATPGTAPSATSLPTVSAAASSATSDPTTSTPAPSPAAQAAAGATPACTPGELTLSQTEGPYYKANPPQRASLLEPGMTGTRLTVTGYVLTAGCKPIPGARVDFWQANAQGQYDNAGYRLRGYQLTGEDGRYTLETVVPGEYPGRTPHIHVKVQAPGGRVLTTQIYFPGERLNDRDSIFNPALLAEVEETANGKVATFNFVLEGE